MVVNTPGSKQKEKDELSDLEFDSMENSKRQDKSKKDKKNPLEV